MHYEQIEGRHPRHQELRPAVRNLIFVHASQSQITEMKMTRREMAPLRYMMRPIHDDGGQTFRREIIVVPDRQMENFMRVASVVDDRVFYIENLDFAGKPGQRVRVVDGDFAGVEGIIKRVKKNKRVVVQIEHVAAVAIAFLPSAYIEILD
jgi:transcription antitermination factor NusG